MARLPQPGGDNGNWGNVLNDFLAQAHNADGTIKPNAVGSSVVQDGTISNSKLNVTGGSDGQVLTKQSAAAGGLTWSTPSGGADATTTTKGIVQLAGDLSGTAAAPTVPGLAGKASTSTSINTTHSLTGGGDLTATRTLSLVNDATTPGNDKYYGTDSSGAKGFFDLPTNDIVGQTMFVPATDFSNPQDTIVLDAWSYQLFGADGTLNRSASFHVPANVASVAVDIIWTGLETSGDVRWVGGVYWLDPAHPITDSAPWQLAIATGPTAALHPITTRLGDFSILPGSDALGLFMAREGADGADTYGGDAYLLGIKITVTATVPLP